jgi:serine/threonine-protein kinase
MTDSDPPANDDPLFGASVETSIGTIIVERVLGRGGFATVYAGRGIDRPVAIKVLHAEHIGSKAVMRFAREVAIVRRLRHPNIAEVLNAGTLPDGRPYCTMELLHGRELAAALKDGPLAPPDIVDIVSCVADALGAAHAVRVVHRDVKARNVFLCEDGRVVLLDFGVAKLAIASGLTMSREAVGTLGSMAPEQLAGRPVDARADIYALGALVHHMATGHVPFRHRDTAIEVQLHRFAQRPRPSQQGAPEALDAVVAKAMAIRPADRYARAADLADAVRAALGSSVRTRARAIGIHLESLATPDAPDALDVLHDAAAVLAAHGFRPIAAGIAGGAWWCAAAGFEAGSLRRTLRGLVTRGVAVAIHVDDLDVYSGQAVGGPLSELWRWVSSTAPAIPAELTATPGARAALELDT